MKSESCKNNSDIFSRPIYSVETIKEYAHLREIEKPSWKGSYLAELRRRFPRGDLRVSVFENGNIVSHVFVNHGHFDLDEVSCSHDH